MVLPYASGSLPIQMEQYIVDSLLSSLSVIISYVLLWLRGIHVTSLFHVEILPFRCCPLFFCMWPSDNVVQVIIQFNFSIYVTCDFVLQFKGYNSPYHEIIYYTGMTSTIWKLLLWYEWYMVFVLYSVRFSWSLQAPWMLQHSAFVV